jgi:nitrogen fixation NifU-like protein
MNATPVLLSARRDNPLCGDTIEISVGIGGGVLRPVGHEAHACSLVITSAVTLLRLVDGRTVAEARVLADRIERALRHADSLPEGADALAPALLLPARRRCVLLPWQALIAALETQ